VKDLIKLGLWDVSIKNQIIADRGSVQNIKEIPENLRLLYKTVWEIKQRCVLDMAADRGAFIDQSQSLNIHLADITAGKLTATHFHGWKLGLKTGLYYLRTKPKADAIQFTVDQDAVAKSRAVGNQKAGELRPRPAVAEPAPKLRPSAAPESSSSEEEGENKKTDEEEECLMCGS
jgi:ribonucleotide reductase alpha subunit